MAAAKNLQLRYDRFVAWLNRFAGNIAWGESGGSLPDRDPVAWRERARAAVCIPRHMFRLLCLICTPTIFILLAISCFDPAFYGNSDCGTFGVFLLFLWLPAVLVPAVYVGNLISGERADQTLDVLLTTPIEPQAILRQKLAALPRLMLLITLPMVMVVLTECYGEYLRRGDYIEGFLYLALSLVSIAVYEWLIVWTALACSLRVRQRSMVVMLTLVRLLGFAFVPLLLAFLFTEVILNWSFETWMPISPLFLIPSLEFNEFDDSEILTGAVMGLIGFGLIGFATRRYCFAHAARFLHRSPRT